MNSSKNSYVSTNLGVLTSSHLASLYLPRNASSRQTSPKLPIQSQKPQHYQNTRRNTPARGLNDLDIQISTIGYTESHVQRNSTPKQTQKREKMLFNTSEKSQQNFQQFSNQQVQQSPSKHQKNQSDFAVTSNSQLEKPFNWELRSTQNSSKNQYSSVGTQNGVIATRHTKTSSSPERKILNSVKNDDFIQKQAVNNTATIGKYQTQTGFDSIQYAEKATVEIQRQQLLQDDKDVQKGLNELMSLIKREKQVILDEVNRLSALANSYKAAYEEIKEKYEHLQGQVNRRENKFQNISKQQKENIHSPNNSKMPVNHTYLKMVELLKTMNFDYHLIMPELEIDNINESSGKKSTPTQVDDSEIVVIQKIIIKKLVAKVEEHREFNRHLIEKLELTRESPVASTHKSLIKLQPTVSGIQQTEQTLRNTSNYVVKNKQEVTRNSDSSSDKNSEQNNGSSQDLFV